MTTTTPPAVLFENVFTPLECAEIIAFALQQQPYAGTIGYGGAQQQHNMRRSTVRWLSAAMPEMMLVKARMDRLMLKANAQHWGLDARGFTDFQFTEYSSSNEGHYDFHRDDNPQAQSPAFDRVLSAVVQLVPLSWHQGGRLELQTPGFEGFKNQGDVVIFPSRELHRVTPVTGGCRWSLVTWSLGPRGQFESDKAVKKSTLRHYGKQR